MSDADAKRLIEDIEKAKERLKQTIEPPEDEGVQEPEPTAKPGFFARLFGRAGLGPK